MDYGKAVGILRYLNDNADEMVNMEFISPDFFIEYSDALQLSTFVDGGWATLTDEGKKVIGLVWNILCQVRDINPLESFDSPMDFFRSQALDAEVIPIERGRK